MNTALPAHQERGEGAEIGERTLQFAVRSVHLYQHLRTRNRNGSAAIGGQFLRCATSIGANIAEAQCAESRKDFVHKMRIAQKEARECRYWLKLFIAADLIDTDRSSAILRESDEILKVVSAIILSSHRSSN